MISKSIVVSITKTSLLKIRLCLREYEYDHAGGLIRIDLPTVLFLYSKSLTQKQGLVFQS